ncbi:MAG TPA: 5-(carboxyamino)imidazole ribonucleotide synthase [Cyanothece sp. UBA12306]|nr:5-(carboxyamino)imidazole ribonucleotide synthase [Cyanothece sp. UBA12306]
MTQMTVKRVGVIGGGQLAWMMAEAAQKLGIDLVIQTPSKGDPAVSIAKEVVFASIDDAVATAKLSTLCDVITFENEFINLEALKSLETQGVCFRPSLKVLNPLLDKYQQRCYLKKIGLPTPQFAALENPSQLEFDFPLVLKSRRHGYDGQGTFIIQSLEQLKATCNRLEGVSLMVEQFIPFERELAVMAARSVTGEVIVYPVVETYQQDQVCHWVIVPAGVSEKIQKEIREIADHLLNQLGVVGIFGIELFSTSQGQILVNEIAPRTHNSGHYTLDGCDTSQFEMQLRAVSGLSLGSPKLKSSGAVMVNLLGYEESHHDYSEQRHKIAKIARSFVHWYGKTESRPGRKLGHATVLIGDGEEYITHETSRKQLLAIAQKIESIWYHQY